jgi:uncharacterized protein
VGRVISFSLVIAVAIIVLIATSLPADSPAAFAQSTSRGGAGGSRPAYIYDNAHVISSQYYSAIDRYLRGLDDATTDEIVIYTIPSFVGHGIKKDGTEIQDRDMLANYIFNELSLDGIKGIGKKGKDNGVLVLMSLERDASGGSLRIEVGRGLEGNITDGTAGAILDRYLVPARQQFSNTKDTSVFGKAFLGTVMALGARTGYSIDGSNVPLSGNGRGLQQQRPADNNNDNAALIAFALIFALIIGVGVLNAKYGRRSRGSGGSYIGWGGYGGGWGGGGGGSGGGYGGGGGSSGGGGAGR